MKASVQQMNVQDFSMQAGNLVQRRPLPVFAPPPIDNQQKNSRIDDILAEIVFGDDGVNMYGGSFPVQQPPVVSAYSPHLLSAESHQQFLKQQIQSSAQHFVTESTIPVSTQTHQFVPNQYQQQQQPQIEEKIAIPAQQQVIQPKKRQRTTAPEESSFQLVLNEKLNGKSNDDDIAVLVRKERNKEHAKRSRTRKKFLLDSFQFSLDMLTKENQKLTDAINQALGEEEAQKELSALHDFSETKKESGNPTNDGSNNLLTTDDCQNNTTEINKEDAGLLQSLQSAEFSFVITNPSIPDNPIVFASPGFLKLTGYTLHQVLGRNCRFLQGKETNPATVEKLRNAVKEGRDESVCLLNYTADGEPFWNQFYLAPLHDSSNQLVNFVGIQCKVTEENAKAINDDV